MNRLTTFLVASLSLACLPAFGQKAPDHLIDVFVKAPGKTKAQLTKLLAGVARVESRDSHSGEFKVRPLPGHSVAQVRARIARDQKLRVLRTEASDGHLDMTSASSIKKYIDRMEKKAEREEEREREEKERGGKEDSDADAPHPLGPPHEREIGVDYLEALHYFIQTRAFPKDSIDWSAYGRAAQRRDAMPAYQPKVGTNTFTSRSLFQVRTTTPRWEFIGPNNLDIPYRVYYGVPPLSGRVNALAIDPNNGNTMYLGGAMGGVWKSTDAGAHWTNLSNDWDFQPVNCIAIDPTNANTIYVGLGDNQGSIGYGSGIMKSTNGGQTWTEIARSTMGADIGVTKILIDPDFPSTLIATTGGAPAYWGKIYRSTNGGSSWSVVNSQINSQWSGLTVGAKNGSGVRHIYAAAQGYSDKKIWRSDDHGATWTATNTPTTTTSSNYLAGLDIAASPTSPDTLYLICGYEQRIAKSINAGSTWTSLTANFPTGGGYNWSQGGYDYYIACSKSTSTGADVVYTGLIDVVLSPDGGNSWVSYGGPTYSNSAVTHNDQHSFAIDPQNPNRFLFGNDGGVFLGVLNPATTQVAVTSLNKNIGLAMFYSAAFHPTDPTRMLGGTQDNAAPIAAGDLSNWLNGGAGDGTGTAVNTGNPLIQYNTWQGLGDDGANFTIARTGDGWNSLGYIGYTSSNDNALFVAPLAVHPANPNLLMAGSQFLAIFDETTGNWSTKLGGQRFTSNQGVNTMAGAPTDVNTIYVGTSDGLLYKTSNKGQSWRQLTGFPVRSISSISVSPTNANDILVGLQGTGSAHVYRCSDTTATTPAFTSVATGLPDISLNAIARDMDDPLKTWWVGTDVGVFVTTNSGTSWSNATAPLGLPNVQVNALVSVPGTRYLMAGTYGRGMWRLSFPNLNPGVSNLTFSTPNVRRNKTVSVTITLQAAAPAGGTVVQLASGDTSRLTLPASATVPQGQTSVTVTAVAGSNTGPVTVTATSSNSFNGTINVVHATVSGKVVFSDYKGNMPSTVVFSFRRPGQLTAFQTVTGTLDATGAYTLVDVPEEAYDIYIQTSHYLRRTIRVDVSTADASGIIFGLINGDINGDNVIDNADQTLLTAAYRSNPSTSNWNPLADLNGDGVVSASDQAILGKNFGTAGDR